MKKISYYLLMVNLLLIGSGCIKRDVVKKKNYSILDTYVGLLQESEKFINQKRQEHFKDSLQAYIKNCKDYDFNNGRLEAVICQPILLDVNYDKAIIPVLNRTRDMSGERVEYVKYICAKYESGIWFFKIKKGWSKSFSYVNNYPTLSDTEIGIKLVGYLLSIEFIDEGRTTNDLLFKKEIYVW